MDKVEFWVGLGLGTLLAIPAGVLSIFIYNWLMRQLEQRRLIRETQTREQAIRTYKRIVAFRNGRKDKYAYYLMTVGWATFLPLVLEQLVLSQYSKAPRRVKYTI